MIYTIKNVGKNNIDISDSVWGEAQVAKMDNYVWDETGFKPQNFAMGLAGDSGITVLLSSDEHPVTATKTEFNSQICEDSCLEVFINANQQHDNRYFNFETNANGVVNAHFRKDRKDKTPLTVEDANSLNIKTEVLNDYWTVEYTVTFDFIKKFIPDYEFKKGMELKSNVYKCGEETEVPHFGMWQEIKREKPDFHQPDDFGVMYIE